MSKKNNHMHKTIFMSFGNLPTSMMLQGFHYYQGKIQSAAIQFFLSQKLQRQTLITKIAFSTSYAQDSQCATVWAGPSLCSMN